MPSKENFVLTDAQKHFDSQAQYWKKKFTPRGSMSGRPALFANALQDLLGSKGRVLDFGCGSGDITTACHSAGFRMSGVDISASMIARAQWRSRTLDIDFQCTNSARLPYPDAAFDAVIASSVFEYVVDPCGILDELHRVCAAGGHLVFTIPNQVHPWRWVEHGLRAVIAPDYAARSTKFNRYAEYLRLSKARLSQRKWRLLLCSSGWQLEKVLSRTGLLRMLIARRVSLQ